MICTVCKNSVDDSYLEMTGKLFIDGVVVDALAPEIICLPCSFKLGHEVSGIMGNMGNDDKKERLPQ